MEFDDDSGSAAPAARFGRASASAPAILATRQSRSGSAYVSFDRQELREILSLYGRMVARGEWKDYALDFTPHKAVFSIFRRTAETPLFRIVKDPHLARKQGPYSVVAPTGLILKRGHELRLVLASLEPRPRLVVV